MAYDFSKISILVVEDNRHMTVLIAAMLRAFGVTQIHEASSAEKAWDLFDHHTMDIILLDWVLPGMSGLEFTRRVRTSKDSRDPFVPIVIVTAHSTVDHVLAALDAGANDFLAKPLSPTVLYSRLADIIEHPRSFVRIHDYFGPCRRRHKTTDYEGEERRVSGVPTIDI